MDQIDELDVNDVAVQKKFQAEYTRASRFQKKFLGKENSKVKVDNLDIKSYIKHVLIEGTVEEKRELLGEIQNKLILKERKIILENISNDSGN
ncbi:MAG: hypothetical protein ACOCU8_01380 [Patescibacteria group bacterium]